MEEVRPSEIVELEHGEFVLLRYLRIWPAYAVEWTRRRRSRDQESSFPVAEGRVEVPGSALDWEALRARALAAAEEATQDEQPAATASSRSGLLRYFKRGR